MLAFQQYQIAFAAHIRDPKNNPKPAGVPANRMGVYTHGVYLNVKEAVSACFPVCQKVIGPRKWQQVCKLFFAQHATQTPIFREIPEEFLDFINTHELTTLKLPVFFQQLAHYEWVELAVSAMPDVQTDNTENTDLLNQSIVFAPHMLLAYDYPVHQISGGFKPKTQAPTFLLVYRKPNGSIQFNELNPVTYQLIEQLQQGTTANTALRNIADAIAHPEPDVIVNFGIGILEDLKQQGVIIGNAAKA